MQAFQERLRVRLEAGAQGELATLQAELSRIDRAVEQHLDILSGLADSDSGTVEQVKTRMSALSLQRVSIQARIRVLKQGAPQNAAAVARAQLALAPSDVISLAFDSEDPARLRTTLRRLFPKIVYRGKPDGEHFGGVFDISLSPAGAAALMTETTELESSVLQVRVTVHCKKASVGWNYRATAEPVAIEDKQLMAVV